MPRTLILIVAYNATDHIESVLGRIPDAYWNDPETHIVLSDDTSADDTLARAMAHAEANGKRLVGSHNPRNLGYGGNQKLGYRLALEQDFQVVVLLHGDGQYAPECLSRVLAPILNGEAHVVLGSRMMRKRDALVGGMPLYKFLGNIALTTYQNLLLGTRLREFHTGYRAFHTDVFRTIPFEKNSDGFLFDTELLIQCLDCGLRITEVAVPTFYGDEISHVKSLKYGLQVVASTLASRLQKRGLIRLQRFEYGTRA